MKQLDNLDAVNGTSWHGHYVTTTVNKLKEVCGTPYYGHPDDKVQHEWTMATEDGTPFTIYDWKEYRHYENYEKIEWHIGTENRFGSKKAYEALHRAFHLHPKINYNI